MAATLLGRQRGQHISIYLTKEDNAMMQDLAQQLQDKEQIFDRYDSISQFFRAAVREQYAECRNGAV